MKIIQVVPELASVSNKSRQSQIYEQFILNLSNKHSFTIMPYYEHLKISEGKNKLIADFADFEVIQTNIPISDSQLYLIKPKKALFKQKSSEQDISSVLFFNKATAEYIESLNSKFIVHCHSALIGFLPLFLQNNKNKSACLFTLHDLKTDYRFSSSEIRPFLADNTDLMGADSAIKLGLIFSDLVNLCSRKYAQEVQETESEYQDLFKKISNKLYGIMNGIRYGEWNPALDNKIPCKYNPNNLYGRFYNKAILQEQLGFANEDIPLLFFGSRLNNEKGFKLLLDSLDMLIKMPIQVLIYGTGEDYPEQKIDDLLKSSPNIRYIREYNEEFIHLILAGCDFYLLPSKHEPDGISFLYALKYGIIPIAYYTGGLVDAIGDMTCVDKNKINGFFFNNYDSNSFIATIREAIEVWKDKQLFAKYMKNAMDADWSWKSSVRQYEALYKKAEQLSSVNEE